MRRLIGLLAGFLLAAAANGAITYAPGMWKLYRSGVLQSPQYSSLAACEAALRAKPVAIGETITFRCQQATVARGVADPPAPIDCVVSAWSAWGGAEWSACIDGQQTRVETRTRSVVTPAANGGAACPALVEQRTAAQACTPPPVLGQLTVQWTAPTTRVDGTALTNLAGYRIRYGPAPGDYPGLVTIDNPGIAIYVIPNLMPGTYYVVMSAFDAAGLESASTAPVSKTL